MFLCFKNVYVILCELPFFTIVSKKTEHLAVKYSLRILANVLCGIVFIPFVIIFIKVDGSHEESQLTLSIDIPIEFFVKCFLAVVIQTNFCLFVSPLQRK